ncbi:MAG: BrnT family toxin [Candidatus Nealsonbacteria bacterium DGGOD1a]|nr:MAG: BrnT family toxin [Candidatus Nealsonbacteria bacterium DGGOD1a]
MDGEKRFYALGRTNESRFLFEVFTIRNFKIRVISSRSMNKNERDIYLKQYER